jgi:hypothetical protein
MDVGFIRGPDNLTENIQGNNRKKTPTMQKSHDGYTAYLLIIDAATRYIFCFPLQSKTPPLKLIDAFLSKNGQAKKGVITTTPEGYLHKSTRFQDLCKKYGYSKQSQPLHDDLLQDIPLLGLEQPRYTIRTDNGNELAGSENFRSLVQEHRYTLETTAPDTSSQNGLGEHPHRTLKEKVRCLLYTAGLGIEFWSDALLHAVWLYNRTYHSAIDMTPYQAWTGHIPCLDRLLCSMQISKAKRRRPG